jgi:dipeptidase
MREFARANGWWDPADGGRDCLHSDLAAMESFARTNGWHTEGPFNWREAFHPASAQKLRYTATRVWSLFRRAAPSQEFDPAYHRGVAGAEPYPLFIEPDARLTVADVFALMRDHYEGTDHDMTAGVDAGPFGYPVRYRPMGWEVDGAAHTWERPISTQQTGFSMVCQSRGWLPDPVGGVTWYGVDDTDFTCYTPLYCTMERLPASYTRGSLQAFSWDSAWWVFNFVSNHCGLRYRDMIRDVRALQAELENEALDLMPAVERTAVALAESDPELARRFLEDWAVQRAETVTDRWRGLGEQLLTKYNDGYVKDEDGRARERGYPAAWLRTVQGSDPARYRLPEDGAAAAEPVDY